MKILYIITQADGGGAQNYTLTLAKHFDGEIAAGNEAQELFNKARSYGLTTYPLTYLKRAISPWHDFLAVWEIRQLIKTLKPDIVHLNSTKAGILGSFAAIGLKTKVVFTAHGFIFNEPMSWPIKSLYLALEKTASEFRDYIIAVSQADADTATAHKLIDGKKISVIYNGIGQINFIEQSEARSDLGLPSQKIIFGSLSNFYPTKGLEILVQAAGQMPKDVINQCLFVLIGQGPLKQSLAADIDALGLTGNFKLLGEINQAATLLKAFDFFVLPSKKEGFPYAILEAMQAGLPIIASKVGGVPEALGKTGFLVEPNNPKVLAEVLQKLIKDFKKSGPSYFKNLGRQATERALNFSLANMIAQTAKIYAQLISKIK